jgi:hypothetical protein
MTGTGLDDLAHDHVVGLVAGDAGALQRGLDRDAAEVGGREVLERAEQPPHGGAGAADDDRAGHEASSAGPPSLAAEFSRAGRRGVGLGPG